MQGTIAVRAITCINCEVTFVLSYGYYVSATNPKLTISGIPGTVFLGDRWNISCHADYLKQKPESMNWVFEGTQIHMDMFVYDSNFDNTTFSVRIVTSLLFTRPACNQTLQCILNTKEKRSLVSSATYDAMGKQMQSKTE